MEENNFKFKIGFEFQEKNNLCKGAKDNFLIQKQPIFIAKINNERLWHIEIDGADIEFVTPPFADHEQQKLLFSIRSIQKACEILQTIAQNKTTSAITFREWAEGVTAQLNEEQQRKLNVWEQQCLKYLNQPKQLEKIDQRITELKQTIVGLDTGLGDNIKIERGKIFDTIADFALDPSKLQPSSGAWKPEFMPQVTIQHSLKYTLPLVLSLFGAINGEAKIENKWIAAIPFLRNKEKILDVNYLSEENGLIFLHALTCANIKTTEVSSEGGLRDSLNFIKRMLETYNQADAKVNLDFLSRRPFSQMWNDINHTVNRRSTFEELYAERILYGNAEFKSQVEPAFKFVNYAEEYYSPDKKQRRNFSTFRTYYQEELGKIHDNSLNNLLDELLNNGIITTGIIQYVAPHIFDEFLVAAIKSVDRPQERYDFNEETGQLEQVPSEVDALSPPWLQDKDNSMGAYTDRLELDLSYGEAILEMRSIKNISSHSLQAMGLDARGGFGTLLTNSERSLEEDAESLFSILNESYILGTYQKVINKPSYID